jgi:hypothetical protein
LSVLREIKCHHCNGKGKIKIPDEVGLRVIRERAGLLANEFAASVGTHASLISMIEKGKRPCPAYILAAYKRLEKRHP